MRQDDERETASGALLDSPHVLMPKTGFFSVFLFYEVLLLLGLSGSVDCFFTAFSIEIDLLSVFLTALLCTAVCAVRFLLPKRGWCLGLPAAGLWGIWLWHGFNDVKEAFMRVVNVVSEAYSERLSFSLPVFLNLPFVFPDREKYLFTLMALAVQFPLAWLLSWLLIRRRTCLGSFCLTGLLLLFPLAFSILPSFRALGLLFLFWAFLLLASPSLRRRRQIFEERGSFQITGQTFARPVSLLLLPVLALTLFLVYRFCPPETYERPQGVNELRESFSRGVSLPSLFGGKDGTASGEGRVNLAALGKRTYTGKTALQVRYEWQVGIPTQSLSPTAQKDYLKSFVGSVYTGSSWERLSAEEAAQAAEVLDGQPAQTLPADFSTNLSGMQDVRFAYLLTVQKSAAGGSALYSPYGLYAPEGLPDGMEYLDDACLKPPSRLSGLKEYTLSAVAMPHTGQTMSERLDDYFASHATAYSISSEKWDALLEKRSDEGQSTITIISGQLFTPELEGEAKELADRAESYEEFVLAQYTRLPEETRAFLEEYSREDPLLLDVEHFSTLQDYLNYVRDFLGERCSYTLSPPALPWDTDFVEHFLQSGKGYCVHFATAAVAILRTAGIPARYAEGYVVPVKNTDAWITVPDYNAHAWVEVYWSGMGWMPFEVTPAGPDAPAAYADATAPSPGDPDFPTPAPTVTPLPDPTEASEASPGPTASSTPDPAVLQPAGPGAAPPGKGDNNAVFSLFFKIALALGIPLLFSLSLYLLFQISRRLRLYLRKRRFSQKDRNKAALCVYAHLLRLYKENCRLPYHGVGPSEAIEELALRARFSNHVLTEEELQQLTDQAALLEKRLDSKFDGFLHFRCKYLNALF